MPHPNTYEEADYELKGDYDLYLEDCKDKNIEPEDFQDWYEGHWRSQIIRPSKGYQWPYNGNHY